jgi:hypothetical protein
MTPCRCLQCSSPCRGLRKQRSPRRFIQALVQFNDSADLWSANLRLGLLGQANTRLFVVYSDTRGLHETIPSGGGRSLIIKFSRMFDLTD